MPITHLFSPLSLQQETGGGHIRLQYFVSSHPSVTLMNGKTQAITKGDEHPHSIVFLKSGNMS